MVAGSGLRSGGGRIPLGPMLPETPWLMLPAMLLLGFPLDVLLRGEVRFGQVDQMLQRGRKRRLGAWNVLVLALDPVRAGVGAWWLAAGAAAAAVEVGNVESIWVEAAMVGAGALVGLAAQLHTRRDSEYLLAPVGFAAGLVAVLVSPAVAGIALLAAFGALAGMRSWEAFFFGAAASCVVGGFLLGEDALAIPLMVGAALLLPAVAGMLVGRQLMMPGR